MQKNTSRISLNFVDWWSMAKNNKKGIQRAHLLQSSVQFCSFRGNDRELFFYYPITYISENCLLFTLIKLSDYSVQMVTLFWSHLLIFIKIIKILSSDLLLLWVDNKTGKEIFKCLCLFATADLILSLISELLVGVVSLQLFSHVVCIFCQTTVWVRCHVERTFAFNKPK